MSGGVHDDARFESCSGRRRRVRLTRRSRTAQPRTAAATFRIRCDVAVDVTPPLNAGLIMQGAVERRPPTIPQPGRVGSESAGEGAARLDALSRLRLSVKTPWPLALVVPESCADRYNACATFFEVENVAMTHRSRRRAARVGPPRRGARPVAF